MSTGRLVGIAGRPARGAAMWEVAEGLISLEAGLAGDCKGVKFKQRQVTVLAREAWQAVAAEVSDPGLPWTIRRANLLVEGIELPRGKGSLIRIGPIRLEVTGQTYPCMRMEEARSGLLRALARNWRGGVTCRVRECGPIHLGDAVEVLLAATCEAWPKLPG